MLTKFAVLDTKVYRCDTLKLYNYVVKQNTVEFLIIAAIIAPFSSLVINAFVDDSTDDLDFL